MLNPLHQYLYNQFNLSVHMLGEHVIHIDNFDPEKIVQYGLLDGDPYWAIYVLTSDLTQAEDGLVAKESTKEEFWKIKMEQESKIDQLQLILDEDGTWKQLSLESTTQLQLSHQASA